jgi:hypothetical protein
MKRELDSAPAQRHCRGDEHAGMTILEDTKQKAAHVLDAARQAAKV